MDFLSLIPLAASLSLDAMLVAASFGITAMESKWKRGLLIANIFAGTHTLTTLVGFLLGDLLVNFIQQIDHWIAFILLLIIGGNMIREAYKADDDTHKAKTWSFWLLMVLGFSLCGDNLTVGVSLAFVTVDLLALLVVVEVVTLLFSLFGFFVGDKIGGKFEKRARILAGFVIILLGIIILLQSL